MGIPSGVSVGLLLMAFGVATLCIGSLWLGLASVAAYSLGLSC